MAAWMGQAILYNYILRFSEELLMSLMHGQPNQEVVGQSHIIMADQLQLSNSDKLALSCPVASYSLCV